MFIEFMGDKSVPPSQTEKNHVFRLLEFLEQQERGWRVFEPGLPYEEYNLSAVDSYLSDFFQRTRQGELLNSCEFSAETRRWLTS